MVATWIRESDGSFFEAWIVSFQKGVLCLEGSCLSTESQLGRPKLLKVCVLPTWNLSLLEKLRAESWYSCLSGLEHPCLSCFGNLQNTGMPIVAPTPTYQIQTQAYPLRRKRQKRITSLPHKTPRKISCGKKRPSFASAQGVHIPAADTSPFLPPRV